MNKKEVLDAFKRGAKAVWRGYKTVNGKETGDVVTVKGVKEKKDVPSSQDLGGEGSDVVEVGDIKAQFEAVATGVNTHRERPCRMGNSIGHKDVSAGTAGLVVRRNGLRFILSNNHVLANSNDAQLGDEILQPGSYDGGVLGTDSIGTLHQFIPLHFNDELSDCRASQATAKSLNAMYVLPEKIPLLNKFWRPRHTRFQAIVPQADTNLVDCALCMPFDQQDVSSKIIDIGYPSGVAAGVLGMDVQKSGRTTGHTEGKIIGVDGVVQVQYGTRIAVFTDQLMLSAMSKGGDSGSAVLSIERGVTGLLFAGSSQVSIANRIEYVFNTLGVML